MENLFLCIDLKSFYASVECVDRGLDSLKTDLVVADETRGKGTICLAVSPSLKAKGVKNRCRLYEIEEGLDFIIAMPRMKRYMEMSSYIYSIYLRYVSAEDIHVYSIDECFLDITNYLKMYGMSAEELAKKIIDDVYNTTGIAATAGIGTNLYLAKIALDITAKHSPSRIGYLDEISFKRELWHHTPLTDFWGIGRGISKRLEKYGITDMYGITQIDEDTLYDEFGINAELMIDHAYGIETTTMQDIKRYRSKSNSFNNSQILFKDYSYDDALVVLKEMVEVNSLELIEKGLVASKIGLFVRYTKDLLKPASSMMSIGEYTQSEEKFVNYFEDLYRKIVNKNVPIRAIGISFGDVKDECFKSVNLFTDEEQENKEKELSKTLLTIKRRYGRNSILKGTNYQENATQIERNRFIGGHNSGESKDE